MRATAANVRKGRARRAMNARGIIASICDAFNAQHNDMTLSAAVSPQGLRFTVEGGKASASFVVGLDATSDGATFVAAFADGLSDAMLEVQRQWS